eukprot:7927259-Lingulodinium_polyedra.AAC.1
MARRAASMLWHSASWPGLLGLVADQDKQVRLRGIKVLAKDYQVWQEAKALEAADICIKNL